MGEPVKYPRADAADRSGWVIDPAFLRKVKRVMDARPDPYGIDLEGIEEVLLSLEQLK